MHALLARDATRRHDRPAAVMHWRKAAATYMGSRAHLYALLVGWECGGAEGRAVADAACVAMGRSEAVVRGELEAAGAVIPQPQPQQEQPQPQPQLSAGNVANGGAQLEQPTGTCWCFKALSFNALCSTQFVVFNAQFSTCDEGKASPLQPA